MSNCCKNSKDSKQIRDLAEILKVISEPNRLKILCLLKSGSKCVCEVQNMLDLKQNLVSHHLKVLKDAKLIDYEKQGQWKRYRFNQPEIKKHKELFNNLLT
ncbi:MAG: metalloregulator ArsR/SmtB family transcription factor [Candidatus Peregrinibacteria bacterium]